MTSVGKLPTNDGVLEIEEVEGLMPPSSSVGTGQRRSSASTNTLWARLCDGQYRGRWATCITLTALTLLLVLFVDTERLNETGDGVRLDDVETKPPVAPTLQPVAPPPTEPPVQPTEPPVQPTEPPVQPTEPPVQPTEPPVEPTQPPVQPTEPPVQATQPPVEVPKTQEPVATEAPKQETPAVPATPPPTEPPVPAPTAPPTEPPVASSLKYPIPAIPPGTPTAAAARLSRGHSWWPKDYVVRHENPPPVATLEKLAAKWGTWQFTDPKAATDRPDNDDYVSKFPSKDIPRTQFPAGAWQTDADYLKGFLPEADKLIERAMNVILAEYGQGPDDRPGVSLEERRDMFALEFKNFDKQRSLQEEQENERDLRGSPGQESCPKGGWTTQRSFDGLVRRILHALVTRDTFTVVMGGHSAAAGHGNHFRQSYMMQFHQVMEPVFSYLGVELISRNIAQGGLGTIQNALGAGSLYGNEIDVLLWDSGMTEGPDLKAIDMFGRQGMIGGNRVPFLWGGNWKLLEDYHREVDADVGQFGMGQANIPVVMNETHAASIPYAARYLKCDNEISSLCREHKFLANCWVDRPDFTPPKAQKGKPGGQASWHPGNRWHQLTGRVLAFTILRGLKEAIAQWSQAEGFALPDEAWHVTNYYENIRSKVKKLPPEFGYCFQYKGIIPTRMCSTPIKALSQFTPRANPLETSILNIMRPDADGKLPDVVADVQYDGPNVRNPILDIPEGEIDALAILNNGRKIPEPKTRRLLESPMFQQGQVQPTSRRTANPDIIPGKGLEASVGNGEFPGYCDGSWNAVCAREPANDCLLYDHHDRRGGILFSFLSGWIVLDVPKVKEGIIIVKVEAWHNTNEMTKIKGWKTENNERHLRGPTTVDEQHRFEKAAVADLCDDFKIEYAIDGKITTIAGAEAFKEFDHVGQRVVEFWELLDDADYIKEPEGKDVEVAFRMTGCGDLSPARAISFTHIYWA